jgi:hypothetical protein
LLVVGFVITAKIEVSVGTDKFFFSFSQQTHFSTTIKRQTPPTSLHHKNTYTLRNVRFFWQSVVTA